MIKAPSPFPHAGSYAIHPIGGANELVRVIERDGDDLLVSYPLRFGASGNRTLKVADLIDGSPLSPEEARELDCLEAKLAGMKRPRRADVQREAYLRARWNDAQVLHGLINEGLRRKLIDPVAGRLALESLAA